MKKNIIDTPTRRAIRAFGCKNQKQLSKLIGISDADFSNRKRRGTLSRLLEMEAYKRSVNANWLLTGQGEMNAVTAQIPSGQLKLAPHAPTIPEGSRTDKDAIKASPRAETEKEQILTLVGKILDSGNDGVANALIKNVEEFARAVDTAVELTSCQERLDVMQSQINELKRQFDRITAPPIGVEQSDASSAGEKT